MMWKSCFLMTVLSVSALAQTAQVQAKPLTDADVQLIRQDIQAQKTQIITDTMDFSEKEAAAFWPIYKDYASEQQAIAAKRLTVIQEYSQVIDKLDDAKARDLTQRMSTIEDETQALRKKYYPRFEQALGAKRAAKFYQVDNRLTLAINFQLAAAIPLIP